MKYPVVLSWFDVVVLCDLDTVRVEVEWCCIMKRVGGESDGGSGDGLVVVVLVVVGIAAGKKAG